MKTVGIRRMYEEAFSSNVRDVKYCEGCSAVWGDVLSAVAAGMCRSVRKYFEYRKGCSVRLGEILNAVGDVQ